MEAGPLTGNPGFSHRGQDAFAGKLGLSQGGRASYRKSRPLIGRPGLLQEVQATHREARPLKERQDL